MASTDARVIPFKNAAYRVTFPIFDADGDLVTGAAGLDSEVSIDGGTFADCTNEATEIATNSGMYYLDLAQAEMNGDTIAIIVKTSTSGAKTTPIVLYPEEAGDVRVNVTQVSGDTTAADNLESYCDGTTPIPANATQLSGDGTAADNAEAFFDGTGYAGTNNVIPTVTTVTGGATAAALATVDTVVDTIAGYLDTEVAAILADTNELQTDLANGGRLDLLIDAIKAKTDNLPADPADDSDIDAQLATIAGYLDTEVAAILADTNELQTDWHDGGRLDLLLDGAASAGDPWTTALPGAYGAGTAGKIIGDNINAPIATVDTVVDTIAGYLDTEVAAILADTNELQTDWVNGGRLDLLLDGAASAGDPWTTALPGAYGAGTAGKIVGDNINAPIATIDTVVDAIKAKTDNLPADPADDSDIDTQLVAIAGYLDTEVAAIKAKTDNLPASPAAVGSQMDLVNAPNATAVTAIQNGLATAANLATVDGIVDAVKAKTDNLPASPAAVGSQMDFVNAPNATAVTAIQSGLATAAALATVDSIVDAIVADTGTDGVVISTAVKQAIADEVLKRGVSNVEETASAGSLAELILAAFESAISGTTWTMSKTVGGTFNTRTVTTDANALPIVAVT